MSKLLTRIMVAAVVLVVSGCAFDVTNPQPRRVSKLQLLITSGGNSLTVGNVAQTFVQAVFNDDAEVDVTPYSALTSLDTAVVTVAPNGVVTAVGAGKTNIQARYLNQTSEITFYVKEP